MQFFFCELQNIIKIFCTTICQNFVLYILLTLYMKKYNIFRKKADFVESLRKDTPLKQWKLFFFGIYFVAKKRLCYRMYKIALLSYTMFRGLEKEIGFRGAQLFENGHKIFRFY